MEKVEQFIPKPLRCYRCQKYGRHEDSCRRQEVCGKCGQRDPGHHMNECEFPYKCTNCGGDHPVYARSCDIWRREKEILAVKYKNNIPYHEAWKRVVGSNTYTYSQTVQRGKNEIEYGEMVKKLIQLDPSDWGSFINEIKTSVGNKPYKVSTMQGKISTNVQTFTGEDTRDEGVTVPASHQPSPKLQTPIKKQNRPESPKAMQNNIKKKQRSPIRPLTFELNKEREAKENSTKGNNLAQASSPPTRKISDQAIEPTSPTKTKNKYQILEKMETEEVTPVKEKNERKTFKKPP